MLLQVHDELLFEVPEKELDKTRDVTRKIMESAAVAHRAAGRRQPASATTGRAAH